MACACWLPVLLYCVFCFFKQKTAYEMRISDWSSDVCSSDLAGIPTHIERWFSLSRFWPRVRETGATVIDPIGTMVTLICQQPEGPGDRDHNVRVRSEGRRVGKECVSTFRSRWSTSN